MKKIVTILVVATMFLSTLAGCSSKPSSSAAPETKAPETKAESEAPAETSSGEVYTFKYAMFSSEDSARYNNVESVLKKMVEEASGGQIIIELYPNSTLANPMEALDMVQDGGCDMTSIMGTLSAGQFLYEEMVATPGLYYGNTTDASKMMREFYKEFEDKIYLEDGPLMDVIIYSMDQLNFLSKKPINNLDDLKGLTIRGNASANDFYTKLGMAPTNVPSNELYEAIRLGTVDGSESGFSGIHSFQLYEVADYVIPVPIRRITEKIVVNRAKFETMPEDLQEIFLKCCSDMEAIMDAYQEFEETDCVEVATKANSKFTVNQFSAEDIATMQEIAVPFLEAKAKDLDAAGYRGSEALAWLREHSKEIGE